MSIVGSAVTRLLPGGTTPALMVGALVLSLFSGSVVFGLNATHGMPFDTRKTVEVEFGDVNGLTEGDDVRIASRRVGYVEDLRLENGQAVAELEIDDEHTRLYDTATASVSARSPLGQKFVNLDPGRPGSGFLGTPAVIEQARTQGAHDVTGLFNVFDRRTRIAAGSTLRQVGGGLAGRSPHLRDFLDTAPRLLRNTGTVTGALADEDGTDMVALLRATKALSSRFAGRQEQIAALNRQLSQSLQALAVDNGQAVRTSLGLAPDTLTRARGALGALHPPLADLQTAMRKLRPGAHALAAAETPLRSVLRAAPTPLGRVPDVAAHARPALTDLSRLTSRAQPVSGQLERTAANAPQPLSVLSAYRHDIAGYFGYAGSALDQGDDSGNWLRILLIPRTESASGPTSEEDPTVARNPYPAPGQAEHDRAGGSDTPSQEGQD